MNLKEDLIKKIRTTLTLRQHDLATLGLLHGQERDIAYVGWLGFSNMGDEAMFRAVQRALVPTRLRPIRRGRLLRGLVAIAPRRWSPAAILGGGTLIGYRQYRETLEQLFRREAGPLFVLGTGVEDPSFHKSAAGDAWGELRAWEQVLGRAVKLTVRGPLSQEILASRGLSAQVVGDPALLLRGSGSASFTHGLLGVNLALPKLGWGDMEQFVTKVVRGCGILMERGFRLRLIPTSAQDLHHTRAVAAELGQVEIVEQFRSLPRLLTALEECHALIGTRLHSVVLASAVGVPAVMLAYAPKCLDFQASLRRNDWSIRTDQFAVSEMVEKVESLVERNREHRESIRAGVAGLRHLLEDSILSIRDLAQPGAELTSSQ